MFLPENRERKMVTWWWRGVHVAVAMVIVETLAEFWGFDTKLFRELIGMYAVSLVGAAWTRRMCLDHAPKPE
jgi:hypothetical protein